MDQFHALFTECDIVFYDSCMELPSIISKMVSSENGITIPYDTVIEELKNIAGQ